MKLGVSYNVFNSHELLMGSIEQIRDNVDRITVVYQTKSNHGQECDPDLVDHLNDLKKHGWVDQLIFYKPEKGPHVGHNETKKRNIGLEDARNNRCTHFMSMDCDEYYIPEKFKWLREEVRKNNYDSTACQLLTYYKTPKWILNPPETYYVSLIYKIRPNIGFKWAMNMPVLIDPSRRMKPGEFKAFTREEIQMHHFSYIRRDISSKFNNAKSSVNFRPEIPKLILHYNEWEPGEDAFVAGRPCKWWPVKHIDTPFALDMSLKVKERNDNNHTDSLLQTADIGEAS